MTPGEEAMREAARIESARIYGQLDEVAREHRADRGQRLQRTPATVVDITAARRRRSA